jgi:sulfide:quinone oxidoreductase
MSQIQRPTRPDHTGNSLEVLIAGGGVAGLEAAFALQALGQDRVSVTLLAASDEFTYRPLSIGEPFTRSHATRHPLAALAGQADASVVSDSLAEVDVGRRVAITATGAELHYDALLVAVGATPYQAFEHATPFDDARADEVLHGLVQDIEEGYLQRLAVVLPAPMPWPLAAYELALMASERAWDMQAQLDVTLVTPERSPLAVFGPTASRELADLLASRRIDVLSSAFAEIPGSKRLTVNPGGRSFDVDRIVAFPLLRGPALAGLPQDGGGFIPVDEYGRVRGADQVWAAGDATDCSIKLGGVAAQLADTAARSIALLAGAELNARPFAPVVEGVLMTGGTPRYLRASPAYGRGSGESVLSQIARRDAPPKIAARYLGPHLAQAPDGTAASAR